MRTTYCPWTEPSPEPFLSPGQTDSQVDARRKFSTCVPLAFRLATHLRWLATTCVDFGRAQIHMQSRRRFFTVWPPNASRHNLIASNCICVKFMTFVWLAWTCEPISESVSVATHRKSVRKFWFATACVGLRVRLAGVLLRLYWGFAPSLIVFPALSLKLTSLTVG